MGGIFLYNYLAQGCDKADGYLTISSPLNMNHFMEVINSNFLYCIIQKRTYKENEVTNMDEFLQLLGIHPPDHKAKINSLLDNLRVNVSMSTLKKLVAIIGSYDPLTKTFINDRINFPIRTVVITYGFFKVEFWFIII